MRSTSSLSTIAHRDWSHTKTRGRNKTQRNRIYRTRHPDQLGGILWNRKGSECVQQISSTESGGSVKANSGAGSPVGTCCGVHVRQSPRCRDTPEGSLTPLAPVTKGQPRRSPSPSLAAWGRHSKHPIDHATRSSTTSPCRSAIVVWHLHPLQALVQIIRYVLLRG